MEDEMNGEGQGLNAGIWIGIAVGAAVGIGIALSRRKKTRWDSAKEIGQRLSDHTTDLSGAATNIIGRLKVICDEGRKIAEDATELWTQGRKLAGLN